MNKPIGKDKLIAEMGARIVELENKIKFLETTPRERRRSIRELEAKIDELTLKKFG